MRHSRLMITMGLLVSALMGCARDTSRFTPLTTAMPELASLDHRAASAEVEVMWTCAAPGAERAEVMGVVRNMGPREVQAVGLEAQSVRSQNFQAQETAAAPPSVVLFGNEHTPFRIDVPLKGAGDRIDLLVLYAVTPAPWTPDRKEPQQNLTIENACAPDRHLRVATR